MEEKKSDAKRKITCSIPAHYISTLRLQERWIIEKERKQKEEEVKKSEKGLDQSNRNSEKKEDEGLPKKKKKNKGATRKRYKKKKHEDIVESQKEELAKCHVTDSTAIETQFQNLSIKNNTKARTRIKQKHDDLVASMVWVKKGQNHKLLNA